MRKQLICILLGVSGFAIPALYADSASAAAASAGVLVGNGFKDGYNVGLGARAGVTLPTNVYVGGTFVYHLGKSESVTLPPVLGGATFENSFRVFYLGGEGGYDVKAGSVTVRPYMGVGYVNFSVSVPGGSDGTGKFGFWPGAAAMFPIGNIFVGADARFVLIADGNDANAFSLFGTVGVIF